MWLHQYWNYPKGLVPIAGPLPRSCNSPGIYPLTTQVIPTSFMSWHRKWPDERGCFSQQNSHFAEAIVTKVAFKRNQTLKASCLYNCYYQIQYKISIPSCPSEERWGKMLAEVQRKGFKERWKWDENWQTALDQYSVYHLSLSQKEPSPVLSNGFQWP